MVNGLSGERMLIGLAVGIAVLIFLVLKTKIQAFLALIISTVVVGVIGGMPLTNITIEVDGVEKTFGIVNSITSGFGGTLGSIGIIIGFGVMMGQIFEVTGAAKRMAHTFLKLFGKKREEEALALTGFLVSIPIFCDSGFVVLAPIAKAISKATKKSVIGLGTALAAGLVITHSLVPPTPGPLGVCGIFGVDVGKFILLTLVLALPMAIACIAYSRLFLSKKYYRIPNDEGEIVEMPYQEPNYEAAFAMDMTGVPGALESFMPLIIPIILILINILLLVLGCFMDVAPLILIVTPILLPVVKALGMDPIHFGIVIMMNLAVGSLTPPVGTTLFAGCAVGDIPIEKATKALLPYYAVMVVALLLVTYIPAFSMTLPNLLMH